MANRRVISSGRREDLRAIKQLAADWRAGWLAGDVDALLALYAKRPVLMPEGRPAVVGKQAIRPLYRAVLNEFTLKSKSRLMEVEVWGDRGYFWSTYKITAKPKVGGKAYHSKGKSVFIVKREAAGVWKIARLIDNSDEAP